MAKGESLAIGGQAGTDGIAEGGFRGTFRFPVKVPPPDRRFGKWRAPHRKGLVGVSGVLVTCLRDSTDGLDSAGGWLTIGCH